jgi:hypothetical protein
MLCSLEKHASLENGPQSDHSSLEEFRSTPKSARYQCVLLFQTQTAKSTLPYENRDENRESISIMSKKNALLFVVQRKNPCSEILNLAHFCGA